MTIFDIDIISDTVCPWCYLGYRRLQKAISLYQKTYPNGSKDTFNITWKPFYLQPSAPKEGIPIQDRMLSRMPGPRVTKIQQHLQSVGSGEGITFTFSGKTGNTRLSHQLLEHARRESLALQGRVAEEIFRLHLEAGGDITDAEMLVAAGVNVGLQESRVREWLADEEAAAEVDREVEEARAKGVKGVPYFVVQGGEHEVDGAGDVMDFFEIFVKVKEVEGEGVK